MTTPTKSIDTRSQLRSLMSQHTATTARPPAATATPAPTAAVRPASSSTPALAAKPAFQRYSVRLLADEIEKLDAITLEAHQRLGERIAISDVLRIGLYRVGSSAPITADELAALRWMDRRRSRSLRR